MVDFKKLREGKGKPLPINPREIFNALPKPPGINDLYASQAEVLDAWFIRRTEKDIVVKLHTGGGKTLVALLMAQSVMNETGEPVLYLAPTKQLVEQVITKSKDYGVAAFPYVSGQALPTEFFNGKGVLVGTYESLFNGRSKFGVRGAGPGTKVGAIILDDAHVALSSVREAFSLSILAKKHRDVYDELAARFRQAFVEVGRGGSFADIIQGKDFGVLEVPSWAWLAKIQEVQGYLASKVGDIDAYVWPLLRDTLSVCHCLFSKTSVTITPIFPPVDLLPTFDDSGRRIYMSATIADDSEIVRTFGASAEAVGSPITSTSLAGVGERMILVPELMKLGSRPITPLTKNLATSIAANKMGVAVLTPSGEVAKTWADVAHYPDKSAEVSESVAAMQAGKDFGPLVLANRYDGIDLAGNACRCLVMDGLPQGTSDYEMFRANVVADSAVNSLMAQRIEQGIGRGTRGGSDFCVVVLIGSRLVGWVGKRKNLAHLTASTRVQLKMGREVSDAVTTVNEMDETVRKCLGRDPDWVAYHASELADAAYATPVDHEALSISGEERRAFRQFRLGQYEAAIQSLESLMGKLTEAKDTSMRAWLASMAARVAFALGSDARGQRYQTNAFAVNNNHTPPKVRPAYVPRPLPGRQSKTIVEKLLEYDRRGALLADFDEAVVNLVPEASAGRYEEALANLGTFLGFDADRPEKLYQVGPDVLWRTDAEFDFVIEAKNEKDSKGALYKKDHAQLLEAQHWFEGAYPNRSSIRVSALPEPIADSKATPDGTMALRLAEIAKLVSALREVFVGLINCSGDADALREHCEVALQQAKLKAAGIRSTFLTPFAKATK